MKLPEGWKEVELGEVLDYEQPTDYIVSSEDYSDEYKTPVLTAGKSFILGYTDETNGIYTKFPVIIFDDFTTASHYVTFPFKVKSSAMKFLTPKTKEVNLKYIFWLMQTIKVNSESHKRYYLSKFQYLKIPLPPLPTQQKIVSILEKAEQAKELRKTADELTKEFLKSVFMEMFGDPKHNSKKWDKNTLENNCIRICVSYVGPCDKYYTTSEKGVPMIRTGNLKENYLDITDLKYVTRDFHEKNIKSQLHFGDLLIARHGANGQAALVPENLKIANCLNVVIIRTNKEKYNPIFLQWLFNSASTLHQISGKTGGSTQSVINTHAIQKLNLIVPPLPLQQKFASIVKEVESMKEEQKHSKEHLDKLFNALMQKAFKGEIYV